MHLHVYRNSSARVHTWIFIESLTEDDSDQVNIPAGITSSSLSSPDQKDMVRSRRRRKHAPKSRQITAGCRDVADHHSPAAVYTRHNSDDINRLTHAGLDFRARTEVSVKSYINTSNSDADSYPCPKTITLPNINASIHTDNCTNMNTQTQAITNNTRVGFLINDKTETHGDTHILAAGEDSAIDVRREIRMQQQISSTLNTLFSDLPATRPSSRSIALTNTLTMRIQSASTSRAGSRAGSRTHSRHVSHSSLIKPHELYTLQSPSTFDGDCGIGVIVDGNTECNNGGRDVSCSDLNYGESSGALGPTKNEAGHNDSKNSEDVNELCDIVGGSIQNFGHRYSFSLTYNGDDNGDDDISTPVYNQIHRSRARSRTRTRTNTTTHTRSRARTNSYTRTTTDGHTRIHSCGNMALPFQSRAHSSSLITSLDKTQPHPHPHPHTFSKTPPSSLPSNALKHARTRSQPPSLTALGPKQKHTHLRTASAVYTIEEEKPPDGGVYGRGANIKSGSIREMALSPASAFLSVPSILEPAEQDKHRTHTQQQQEYPRRQEGDEQNVTLEDIKREEGFDDDGETHGERKSGEGEGERKSSRKTRERKRDEEKQRKKHKLRQERVRKMIRLSRTSIMSIHRFSRKLSRSPSFLTYRPSITSAYNCKGSAFAHRHTQAHPHTHSRTANDGGNRYDIKSGGMCSNGSAYTSKSRDTIHHEKGGNMFRNNDDSVETGRNAHLHLNGRGEKMDDRHFCNNINADYEYGNYGAENVSIDIENNNPMIIDDTHVVNEDNIDISTNDDDSTEMRGESESINEGNHTDANGGGKDLRVVVGVDIKEQDNTSTLDNRAVSSPSYRSNEEAMKDLQMKINSIENDGCACINNNNYNDSHSHSMNINDTIVDMKEKDTDIEQMGGVISAEKKEKKAHNSKINNTICNESSTSIDLNVKNDDVDDDDDGGSCGSEKIWGVKSTHTSQKRITSKIPSKKKTAKKKNDKSRFAYMFSDGFDSTPLTNPSSNVTRITNASTPGTAQNNSNTKMSEGKYTSTHVSSHNEYAKKRNTHYPESIELQSLSSHVSCSSDEFSLVRAQASSSYASSPLSLSLSSPSASSSLSHRLSALTEEVTVEVDKVDRIGSLVNLVTNAMLGLSLAYILTAIGSRFLSVSVVFYIAVFLYHSFVSYNTYTEKEISFEQCNYLRVITLLSLFAITVCSWSTLLIAVLKRAYNIDMT